MIKLQKITSKNVWDILKLQVSVNQNNFVANNIVSIIEAYTTITCNGHAFAFGIYKDEMPVGFLLIGFDCDDYWEDAPQIAKGNYNLWRLMIDKHHQGQGYGRKAVELALAFINTHPCGPANYCWLSYEEENNAARHLYQSFGFIETDEKDGNEIIAILQL
ncbi:GNAT family N-acetyltransferase [Actinomyces vulturis]|uniref:GNAT family N-acetyltransferase n=1 Tax=Actinomyces vulturis TaxID=1857645 RepID=UPI00082CB816|nr:GNAT family N-acetyltransferase [Actinomyces vulturis]